MVVPRLESRFQMWSCCLLPALDFAMVCSGCFESNGSADGIEFFNTPLNAALQDEGSQ